MSKIKTDTSLWLHNKLGNVNDLWSSSSICSQLNKEVLKNIRDCFIDLQALVKVKLLISFLHIPSRNVEEWKNELADIIDMAIIDSDQWVSMVGELLKVYPQTGTINFEIAENAQIFNELIADLKKLIKKHSDQGILPIECLFLNKNALNSIIGNMPAQNKHFTLKRKPKSAALRAELLQKSTDAASNVKKGVVGGSIPIRHRSGSKDLSDTTPLKGIPSRIYGLTSSVRNPPMASKMGIGAGRAPTRPNMPGVRRDGGIKLLDITEQPLGPDAKRKKRTQEHADNTSKNVKEADKNVTTPEVNATPDYAAGLMSFVPPSPAPAYLPSNTLSNPPSVGPTPGPSTSAMAVGLKAHNIQNQTFNPNPNMDT